MQVRKEFLRFPQASLDHSLPIKTSGEKHGNVETVESQETNARLVNQENTETIVDRDDKLEARGGKPENDKRGNSRQRGGKMKSQSRTATTTMSLNEPLGLCNRLETCDKGTECKFNHDVEAYLATKGENLGLVCHNYETIGYCKCGIQCRFSSGHVDENYKNLKNEALFLEHEHDVVNIIDRDVQKKLRNRNTNFERTDSFYTKFNAEKKIEDARLDKELKERKLAKSLLLNAEAGTLSLETTANISEAVPSIEEPTVDSTTTISTAEVLLPEVVPVVTHEAKVEAVSDDNPMVLAPKREKKRIDFRGKTYLAPLTTVGNLPFRRICKGFGVEITCGEMALSQNLLNGMQSEWALMRRHKCEDIFGVQLCGSSAPLMTKTAELINAECVVDFIDINAGCPIDMVFNTGAGSALMEKQPRVVEMLRGMSSVIDCSLTLKIRTGVHDSKPTAHKLVERFKGIDLDLVTIHGRSRQQRYSKLANWEYISQVGKVDANIPVFGNGDVMDFDEYNHLIQKDEVDGIMIGRGALIKPWIFTEIKEQKVWDISSSERLDMLKTFGNFGLEQWGSDTKGINNTRRFMCEWLSFLCRYVPVGLLETRSDDRRGLQMINDRPPAFVGRDDLETLMASPLAADWIKLSEMVLGPSSPDFHFAAKYDFTMTC